MSSVASAYQAFADLLAGNSTDAVAPAELQGLLIGRCSAGAGFALDKWLLDAELLFADTVPTELHQALAGLLEMVKAELNSTDTPALTLLLPADDTAMSERILALTQWCQGFLTGFGAVIGEQKLAPEIEEVLQDMVQIAQLELSEEQELAEADEFDFAELVEYLRVTPLYIYNELVTYQQPAPASEPAQLH